MPKIPYTKIYMSDWIAWRRKLPPETLCEILDAIADYCTFGEKPEVKPEDNPRVIEVLTTLMQWATDCEKAYQSNLEKGKKGGRPKSGAKKPEVKLEEKPQVKLEKNLGVKQPEPEPEPEPNTETEIKEKTIKKEKSDSKGWIIFIGQERKLGFTQEQWQRYQSKNIPIGVQIRAIDILEDYAINSTKNFSKYKDLERILTRGWAFIEAKKTAYEYLTLEKIQKEKERVGL